MSLLVDNAGTLVTNDPELGEGPLGLIEDAAVVFAHDGTVAWAGPRSATPEGAAALADAVAKRITELSRVPSPGTGNIATVVQPAVPPASASSPRVLLNTAIAAALGMALGVLISLVPAYRRANRAPEPVVTRLEPAVDS